ncbi:phospholipase D zeta 1-like protein, partial [Tanacetum coccineum]
MTTAITGCGNIAAILELDAYLNQQFCVFEAAPHCQGNRLLKTPRASLYVPVSDQGLPRRYRGGVDSEGRPVMVMHPATLDFFRKVLTDIELMMVPMSEGIKYSELVSRYFSHTGEEYCDNYSYADVILKENKEAADAEKWKGALEEATGLAGSSITLLMEDPFDTKLLDIILFDVLSPSNGDKGDQVLLAEEVKERNPMRYAINIYILIYKEVSIALKINSSYSQKRLLNIHENVKVMRYPDHFAAGIYLWSHHEKIVVVDHQICFLGGLDLCFGRYDTIEHKVGDHSPFMWPGKDYYNP